MHWPSASQAPATWSLPMARRQLGGLAREAGDWKLPRDHWERSAELAERAAWVPLALAGRRCSANSLTREEIPTVPGP